MMPTPERGDLVYVEFDPQAGHEQSGTRPGLILSPKAFNQATGFTIICPITRLQRDIPLKSSCLMTCLDLIHTFL